LFGRITIQQNPSWQQWLAARSASHSWFCKF